MNFEEEDLGNHFSLILKLLLVASNFTKFWFLFSNTLFWWRITTYDSESEIEASGSYAGLIMFVVLSSPVNDCNFLFFQLKFTLEKLWYFETFHESITSVLKHWFEDMSSTWLIEIHRSVRIHPETNFSKTTVWSFQYQPQQAENLLRLHIDKEKCSLFSLQRCYYTLSHTEINHKWLSMNDSRINSGQTTAKSEQLA